MNKDAILCQLLTELSFLPPRNPLSVENALTFKRSYTSHVLFKLKDLHSTQHNLASGPAFNVMCDVNCSSAITFHCLLILNEVQCCCFLVVVVVVVGVVVASSSSSSS